MAGSRSARWLAWFSRTTNEGGEAMKVLALILALLTATATAQQPAEAFLIDAAGGSERVWITSATHDKIRYQKDEQGGDSTEAAVSGIASISLLEPAALSEAIDLFQARQYVAAKAKFAAIKTAYQSL